MTIPPSIDYEDAGPRGVILKTPEGLGAIVRKDDVTSTVYCPVSRKIALSREPWPVPLTIIYRACRVPSSMVPYDAYVACQRSGIVLNGPMDTLDIPYVDKPNAGPRGTNA